MWLPPAKNGGSPQDVGYGIDDLFVLGEVNQKGSEASKYGTRAAIEACHAAGIRAYAATMFNDRMWANAAETYAATPYSTRPTATVPWRGNNRPKPGPSPASSSGRAKTRLCDGTGITLTQETTTNRGWLQCHLANVGGRLCEQRRSDEEQLRLPHGLRFQYQPP
jgi:hypothetical protein